MRDLNTVADIDESLLGIRRVSIGRTRLERAETSGVPSLVAEVDGKVLVLFSEAPAAGNMVFLKM